MIKKPEGFGKCFRHLRRNSNCLNNADADQNKQRDGNVEFKKRVWLRLKVDFGIQFIKAHGVGVHLIRDAILIAAIPRAPLSTKKMS